MPKLVFVEISQFMTMFVGASGKADEAIVVVAEAADSPIALTA
jgi:hypothetical protein